MSSFCDECIVAWWTSHNPIVNTSCPICRQAPRVNYVTILMDTIIPDYLVVPGANVAMVNTLQARIATIGAIGPAFMPVGGLGGLGGLGGPPVEASLLARIAIGIVVGYALRNTPQLLVRLLLLLREVEDHGARQVLVFTTGTLMVIYFLVRRDGFRGGGGGEGGEPYYLEINEGMLSMPNVDILEEAIKKYPMLQKSDILALTIDTGLEFTEGNKKAVNAILNKPA